MYKSDQQYETRIKLVEKALKQNRSKTEIQENLRDAGIIDKKGNLKKPYNKMYIPSE